MASKTLCRPNKINSPLTALVKKIPASRAALRNRGLGPPSRITKRTMARGMIEVLSSNAIGVSTSIRSIMAGTLKPMLPRMARRLATTIAGKPSGHELLPSVSRNFRLVSFFSFTDRSHACLKRGAEQSSPDPQNGVGA